MPKKTVTHIAGGCKWRFLWNVFKTFIGSEFNTISAVMEVLKAREIDREDWMTNLRNAFSSMDTYLADVSSFK